MFKITSIVKTEKYTYPVWFNHINELYEYVAELQLNGHIITSASYVKNHNNKSKTLSLTDRRYKRVYKRLAKKRAAEGFSSPCTLCRNRIYGGDFFYCSINEKKKTFSDGSCRYFEI